MIDEEKLLSIPIVVHDGCWIGANSTILLDKAIKKERNSSRKCRERIIKIK